MTILTSERAMQSIQQTPPILRAVIGDLSAAQAQGSTDGVGGWSITEVVCHMRDYEGIVQQRIRLMLSNDYPNLPMLDNDEAAQLGEYDVQDVHEVLDQFEGARFLTQEMLVPLTDALWQRRGVHPMYGDMSVIEVVINAALHDVSHIDQIARVLNTYQAT